MMRHPVIRAVTVLLLFAPAAPVAADVITSTNAVYDTVDAVELHSYRLTITGIVHGASTATTLTYQILDLNTNFSTEAASRCDRLALLIGMQRRGAAADVPDVGAGGSAVRLR